MTSEDFEHPGGSSQEWVTLSPLKKVWRDSVVDGWLDIRPMPRKYLVRHPDKDGIPCPPRQGDGFVPAGKVVVLSSAGGVGKSYVLLQLAVSMATSRKWLGRFDIGASVAKRSLLLMGEEDAEEVHRRLFDICEALSLTEDEHQLIRRLVKILPLHGTLAPLFELGERGEVVDSVHLHELRRLIAEHSGSDPFGLVVLDPLSRFAGVPVEKDNEMATAFVTKLEGLSASSGHPTIIVSAHSSKAARREGSVDSRGVTGITDAARQHLSLVAKEGGVDLAQEKSNYSRPCDPVRLQRGVNGILMAESPVDRKAREAAVEAIKADKQRAKEKAREAKSLQALRKRVAQVMLTISRMPEQRSTLSRVDLSRKAHVGERNGPAAIRYALGEGWLTNKGGDKSPDICLTSSGKEWLDEWQRDGNPPIQGSF